MHTMAEIETAFSQLLGGRLLDVATGSGAFAAWLADTMLDVAGIMGIDMRTEPLTADNSIFERADAEYRQMDAHALEFTDASFDTVSISYSLHHMADPATVLSELRRVLKPGGHLIIREMHQDDLTEEQRIGVDMHHWWAAVDRLEGITHNETFTRPALYAMIEACALQDVLIFEYVDLSTDPFDTGLHDRMSTRLTETAARAKKLPDGAMRAAQADGLMTRLAEVGMHDPPVLYAVGRKECC